jgi:hypothetical protein
MRSGVSKKAFGLPAVLSVSAVVGDAVRRRQTNYEQQVKYSAYCMVRPSVAGLPTGLCVRRILRMWNRNICILSV